MRVVNRTETPYVETELLLAVMSDDLERAADLAFDMSPEERRVLYGQLKAALTVLDRYGWPRKSHFDRVRVQSGPSARVRV